MLCISMKAGDYFTVGGSTVIQFNRLQGDRVHLVVNAPREVPVLRGEVLERGGGQRPACVFDAPRQIVKQLPWNGKNAGSKDFRQVGTLECGQGNDRGPERPKAKKRRDKEIDEKKL